MSAFIVSAETVSAIATFAAGGKYPIGDRAETAEKLATANFASVNYRYRETGGPDGKYLTACKRRSIQYSIVTVLKQLDCLDYQSCEIPDWEQSEAYKLINRIRGKAIRALPGYDAAPWDL